jgi:hypothetical protein
VSERFPWEGKEVFRATEEVIEELRMAIYVLNDNQDVIRNRFERMCQDMKSLKSFILDFIVDTANDPEHREFLVAERDMQKKVSYD